MLGDTGLPSAKSNAAAFAACDAADGVADGLIDTINKIWDSPRNQRGQRLWGGITPGTRFGTLLFPNPFTAGPGKDPFPFILTWQANWVHEDPLFDWKRITLTDFPTKFQLGTGSSQSGRQPTIPISTGCARAGPRSYIITASPPP